MAKSVRGDERKPPAGYRVELADAHKHQVGATH